MTTVADPRYTNGEQGRGATGAEVERRRREDRGAAGAEGVWEGVMPLPRKKIDLGSQNDDFRCIFGTIFTVQLFGLNTKGSAFRLGKLAVACIHAESKMDQNRCRAVLKSTSKPT